MRKLPAIITLVALTLAACGSSSSHTAAPPTTGVASFPVTVGTVTVHTRPKRVMSLSATATEMLYAVGAGTQVFAVDKYSTYPPNAPHTKLDGFSIGAETVAAEKPDLVLLSEDSGTKLAAGLAVLKIPALNLPPAATIDETYKQIAEVGAVTGHAVAAKAEVGRIRARLDSIVSAVGGRAKGLTYYHELDNTLYSVTSRTFIGQLYQRLGMVNIADAVDKGIDYPQLSAEYVIKSDPDFVFLADTVCCQQTAATFAARPGFATLKAVRSRHVIAVPDDVASHWGPRIVDFTRIIASATDQKS
jgi:iron complex transport system substrate-binding protein